LYPVMVNLDKRTCVIVGGGRVAARKATGLLEAGAWVTVISPTISPELQSLVDREQITLVAGYYVPGILSDLRPLLVFASTDDPTVNQQVTEEGRACGALVNQVDGRDASDFENMASFRRGRITTAISTGGASPALARHLSEHLQASIGEEYVILAEWMAEARSQIHTIIPTQPERAALWQTIINAPILYELRRGNMVEARHLFDRIVNPAVGENT
jgi:precorrin-2 dehydrogenase / sirohydrochlorin ferrochelatase